MSFQEDTAESMVENEAVTTDAHPATPKRKSIDSQHPAVAKVNDGSKSSVMGRTTINFWLDFSMLVNFVVLIWTSTVVRFVFPATVTADGWTLWSWNVDQWIGLQFAVLCCFVLLVVLHLMLHWTWVCGVIASRYLRRREGKKTNVDDGTRTLWGVGLLIICLNIMGIAVAAAVLSIQGPL